MPDQTAAFDNLPLDDLQRIDALCARFEAAWSTGKRPVLEDYLNQIPREMRGALLKELLYLEIEKRRDRGETPTRPELLDRFGNEGQIVDHVWQRLEADRTSNIEAEDRRGFGDPDQRASRRSSREKELPLADGGQLNIPQTNLWESPSADHGRIVKPASREMPRAGELGDRYQWHGEIARGGMGAIIKGRDTNLGRDLAVKVLLESHRDKPHVVQRFVEEAQIGGQLQHPGIVPVYDLGKLRDERPFFSMKLVKGETLSALLRERPDPEHDRGRFLGIFEQICQTMAYAHSRGVIHRDLKPSNIMVGAFGEVQVMDWGLAKVLEQGGIADEKKALSALPAETVIQTVRSEGSDTPGVVGSDTRMGSVMGTPAYMSPEQALGEIDMLDERCDVFGLGAILCEILTDRPPYVADDAGQIHRMAKRGNLGGAWRRLDECTADPEVRELARRCLAPDPADRPRNASVVAAEITAYLESVQVRLREAEVERARAESKAEEEIKRRRVAKALVASLSIASLLLVLLTCGVAITAVYFRNQQQVQRTLAEENGALAVKNGALAKSEGELAQRNERLFQEKQTEADAAIAARNEAESARRRAEFERGTALKNLYFAKVALATEAVRSPGGIGQLEETIQQVREFRTLDDPRGWEWYYLQSLIHQDLMTLHGHTRDVLAIAYSPGGQWLASAGLDRTLRIWDAQTGKEARTLPVPEKVHALMWSPDGQRLASANSDHTASVWDAQTGERIANLSGHTGPVHALAWHPEGERLATSSDDQTIRIWDANGGKELHRFPTAQREAAIAFSPNGERLASASENNDVHIWDPVSGEIEITCRGHRDAVTSLAWRPNGEQLASGSKDHTVKVFTAASGEQVLSLEGHTDAVNGVAWSPDGTKLLSGSADKTVRVWDAAEGRELLTLGGHRAAINSVAWSPDGQRLASGAGGFNGVVKIWDADPVLPRRQLQAHDGKIHAVAWSPSGHRLASCGSDQVVRVWEADHLEPVAVLRGHDQETTAVAFSPDGQTLASGDVMGRIILWDMETLQPADQQVGRHPGTIRNLQWTPDNRSLISSGDATSLWSLSDGKLVKSYGAAGVLSADGTRLATSERYRLNVFDVATGKRLLEIRTLVERFQRLSFSPDRDHLAAADSESILIFENQGVLMGSQEGHAGKVSTFAWSPDSERIASAGADDRILISAPESAVTMLRGNAAAVNSLDWSQDGAQLASGDELGVIRVWDARRGFHLEQPPALRPSLDARLAAQGDDVDALHMRAVTFARSGQWDDAAADFERIAELQGEQAPPFFSTGWWVADAYGKSEDNLSLLQSAPAAPSSSDPFELHNSNPVANNLNGQRPRWYWSDRDPNGYVPWKIGYTYTMARLYAPKECSLMWSMKARLRTAWLNGRWLNPQSLPMKLRPGWNNLVFELVPIGTTNFPGDGVDIVKIEVASNDQPQQMQPAHPLLIKLSSDPQTLAAAYRVRLGWHIARHQWALAAATLLTVLELDTHPPDAATCLGLAALLNESGDLDLYRKYYPTLISRFADSQDAVECHKVAKTCLFAPLSDSRLAGDDLQAVMEMTARSLQAFPDSPWFQFGKGLAELRANRFDSAVHWFDRSLENQRERPTDLLLSATTHFASAVAHHHRGQSVTARELLETGAALVDSGDWDYRSAWGDRLMTDSLRREAQRLIENVQPVENSLRRLQRVLAYAKLGLVDRAAEALQTEPLAPQDPVSLIYHARILAEIGQNEQAATILDDLKQRRTRLAIATIRDPETWTTYAEALSLLKHEEAISVFRSAVALQKMTVLNAPSNARAILDLDELTSNFAGELRAHGRDADAGRVQEELEMFLNAFAILAPREAGMIISAPREAVLRLSELTPPRRVAPGTALEALEELFHSGTHADEPGFPPQEELEGRMRQWRQCLHTNADSISDFDAYQRFLIEALERTTPNSGLETALSIQLRSAQLAPTDGLTGMRAAILYASAGHLERFHELSHDLLLRFGETETADLAEKIAKGCLVAPPREENLVAARQLADKALTLDVRFWGGPFLPWAQLTKGLAEYRGGNQQAAIEWVDKCLAASARVPVRRALALGVRAMALARLDDPEAAGKAATEFTRMLDEHSPLHSSAKLDANWHDWLICEIYLREIGQGN